MGIPSSQGKHEVQAFLDNISHSVVYVVIQTSNEVGNGTCLLLDYKGTRFVASALHVFAPRTNTAEEAKESCLKARFKFRDLGSLQYHETLNIPLSSFTPDMGVFISPVNLLLDKKHDLFAIELPSEFQVPEPARPVEISNQSFTGELTKGLSLVIAGSPIGGAVEALSGDRILHPFLEHSIYDPDLDTSKLPLSTFYRAEDHFLFPYSLQLEGIAPGGFSGAPVWIQGQVLSNVWYPIPAVAGIVLSYYKSSELIQAVKVKHLLALLAQ